MDDYFDRQGIFEYRNSDPAMYYWQTGKPFIPEPGSTLNLNIPICAMEIKINQMGEKD